MLNQHKNLMEPETDFLKVGDCIVDVARREVHDLRSAKLQRITVKSLQVLMMLVAHQGKVVSRVAILEWVWAGTLPSDDVLTQAIAQLRKAFGDDRDTPRYLETIAKGGYRLVAPASWVESLDAGGDHDGAATCLQVHAADLQAHAAETIQPAIAVPVPAPASWTREPRRVLLAVTASATLLVILLAMALYGLTRKTGTQDSKAPPAAAAMKPDYQRITSLPSSEEWPSLSPDGSQVVYSVYQEGSVSAALYTQTTTPVSAKPLTSMKANTWDIVPAWSPTGRDIAFLRMRSDDTCSIMLIPSVGGEAREISPCSWKIDDRIAWHPDGKHLITTLSPSESQESGVIQTIDLSDGRWAKLAYQRGKNDYDSLATYSPDGKWIAFRRNLSLADIWRVPAAGGVPEQLTTLKTNINAIAWTPDGKSIVFGRYLDGGVSIAKFNLATRKVEDLGLRASGSPTIAVRSGAMAFVTGQGSMRLYSIGLNGSESIKATDQLFASSGADLLPSISPDGEQLAFLSDRSGTIAVWWAEVGRPESLRLIEGILPVARYAPVWSTDSTHMLMIGRSDDEYSVYEIFPAAGTVRRLPVPDKAPVFAEYMPEPSRILIVADGGAGRLGLSLYDTSVTPWRMLAHLEDVALTRVDSVHKRILFTRPQTPGLWETSYGLSSPRRISDLPEVGGGRRLIVDESGIWLAAIDEENCNLLWLQLPKSKARPGKCLKGRNTSSNVFDVSLDRIHNRLYFSQGQDMNDDIAFMRTIPR